MPKPSSISLTDFISNHREDFVAFETWLADDLTNLFIVKNDLNRLHTSIIVDIDEDEPIGKTKDGKLTIRLNGRFYLPREDRNSKPLNLDINGWVKIAQEWFDKNEIEVHFDTEAKDLLKFTAFVAALDIPELQEEEKEEPEPEPAEEGTPPEEDSEDTGAEDTGEGSEPEPESSPEESAPEGKEAKEPKEESGKELKEFEEALGL